MAISIFITGPIFVLIHELAHIFPIYSLAKNIYIQLGTPFKGLSKPLMISIGKIHISIFPIILFNGSFGVSNWDKIAIRYKIASLISGPVATFFLMLLTGTILMSGLTGFSEYSLFANTGFLLWQLVFTILPIRYPKSFGSLYSFRESDCLQIINYLKKSS